MALSDEVRKGVVQAQMTGPVTQGAWGILIWEVIIFACVAGNFCHSALVGFIIFFGFIIFIGRNPIYTLLGLSLVYGIGAFIGLLISPDVPCHGIALFFRSIGTGIVIFFVTLIINAILLMFSSDLF